MEWSNVLTSERVPKKEIVGLFRPTCLGYQWYVQPTCSGLIGTQRCSLDMRRAAGDLERAAARAKAKRQLMPDGVFVGFAGRAVRPNPAGAVSIKPLRAKVPVISRW